MEQSPWKCLVILKLSSDILRKIQDRPRPRMDLPPASKPKSTSPAPSPSTMEPVAMFRHANWPRGPIDEDDGFAMSSPPTKSLRNAAGTGKKRPAENGQEPVTKRVRLLLDEIDTAQRAKDGAWRRENNALRLENDRLKKGIDGIWKEKDKARKLTEAEEARGIASADGDIHKKWWLEDAQEARRLKHELDDVVAKSKAKDRTVEQSLVEIASPEGELNAIEKTHAKELEETEREIVSLKIECDVYLKIEEAMENGRKAKSRTVLKG
ncbi:hypothetical protein CC80DRAFT_499361 [Byssothecium circinans]|uniref:Uncharacterized protein n=1 Tax=Byssothecium circinans TaxID=147558 RepID=A0A6A5UFH8_9PLEO|nr:hypothetical protein CC80DRAFT_499361 [Byssothecium circinans]